MTICGAAANFYDSAGRGDRGMGPGQLRIGVWRDGEKRTKQVATVGNHFDERPSLKYGVRAVGGRPARPPRLRTEPGSL